MAYEKNRLGSSGVGSHVLGSVLEYDASRRPDGSSGWKWAVCIVLLVAIVASMISARWMFRSRVPIKISPPVEDAGIRFAQGGQDSRLTKPTNGVIGIISAPHVGQGSTNSSAALDMMALDQPGEADEWAENSSARSARERTLLQRLADAERLGRFAIAVDTIEQLRARPSMADLDDKLARRLGAYNIKRLFSDEVTPWTVEATVKRGQTVHRIAREHGTTVAAVRQLNGLGPQEEPKPGRRLRVLEFPKSTFVLHRQTRHADLILGGKLFKRYYVSVGKNTLPGAYPITSKAEEGPRSRFSALAIRVAPADMLELDMFLAPGSSLTISEM